MQCLIYLFLRCIFVVGDLPVLYSNCIVGDACVSRLDLKFAFCTAISAFVTMITF